MVGVGFVSGAYRSPPCAGRTHWREVWLGFEERGVAFYEEFDFCPFAKGCENAVGALRVRGVFDLAGPEWLRGPIRLEMKLEPHDPLVPWNSPPRVLEWHPSKGVLTEEGGRCPYRFQAVE